MFRIWTLSGISGKDFLKRVFKQTKQDDLFGRAAELSYYFLLALFPLLLFLVTLLGYFAEAGSQLRNKLLTYLSTVMPYSAVDLIQRTLDEISESRSGSKLSFGLLAALWAASNGMAAISETLNIAYDVEETRPWWHVRLVSVSLTVMLAVMILAALVITLYSGKLGMLIAASSGLDDTFLFVWRILQWPIVLAFLLTTFGLIYYFAPDLREKHWEWATPGAVVAVALWLLVSLGFRLYLHFFNSYGATYGSLGALIILMLWFYLTGAAILIGGEINSELEAAARKKRAGEVQQANAVDANI